MMTGRGISSRTAFAATLVVCALAWARPAGAAILSNGDFSGPITMLGDVPINLASQPADTWLLGGNDDTDRWEVSGGVAVNTAVGGEAQGMVQYTQDNKATTGPMTMKFDYDFGAATGDYDLYLYVFGWNSGDAAPSMDLENGTAETGDSFTPGGSVSLITETTGGEGELALAVDNEAVYPGVVKDGGFQTISVGLDFGATGYDYVGVCFYGENSGGTMAIDNVSIVPEPASIALVVPGLLALRRRRKGR